MTPSTAPSRPHHGPGRRYRRLGLIVAVATVAAVALSLAPAIGSPDDDQPAEAAAGTAGTAGTVGTAGPLRASAPGPDVAERARKIRPTPARAYKDLPSIYQDDCVVTVSARRFRACSYGPARAKRTAVLVGDSKALQWFTPMHRITKRQGWRLVVIAKNSCSFANAVRIDGTGRNPSCDAWRSRALRTIKRIRPDLVVPVTRGGTALPRGGTTAGDQRQGPMVRGLVSYWRQVLGTGARLTPILDTPGPPGGDVPGCVKQNRRNLAACAFDRRAATRTSGGPAARKAAGKVARARVIDMSRALCPNGRTCPAVIGNVLVYRSGSHISDTFASTRTAALSRALHRASGGALGRR